MLFGTPNRPRPSRAALRPVGRRLVLLASLGAVPVAWIVAATVDTSALVRAWDTVVSRPIGLLGVLMAFGAAFALRAVAWRRVLPDLTFPHALAALHVALGGNHLLPLRMGEPMRVVSVARRAGIDWERATASTVTLRAADIVAVVGLGAVAGLGALGGSGLVWLVAAVAALGMAVGMAWIVRLRRRGGTASLPGVVAFGATTGAWALEAVVIWQAATWTGMPITFADAMMATSAAVVAQVLAFAPGGIGTYEAGGTAALVFAGHDPATALAVVVAAHAVKTAYSLLGGAVATFVPAPGLLGRLRLPPRLDRRTAAPVPAADGPVVLFLPAHDEEATIGGVISRAPAKVCGRPVVCIVVDDGSTDSTAHRAAAAGARVVGMGANRGLGAAVRRGFDAALQLSPAAVAFCDADGEYAPEELERLVAPILDGEADYVVGSRFRGEIHRMHPHRRLGNRVLTLLLCWVARRSISDGQSGYRAFSPEAARQAEIIHDFNYAQVLTLDLLAKGMRYTEVPISYGFRTTGRSFIRLGRYLGAVVPAVYREVNAA